MHRTETTAHRRQTTARPRSSRLALALGLLALVTAACRDASSPEVTAPNFLISDAAHNAGKPHFYFLPSLVADPQATGTFDPNLAPVVEICALAGSDCGAVVATFTMTTGSSSETVRLDAGAEHYVVNWHTDQFGLDPAVTYRIRVLVGEVELGFADVDVVSSGQELRNVNTGEFIPLRDGRTLPITFRVERGFLARIAVVPVEAAVPIGTTQQFIAALTDLHGATLGGPPVTWASSDEAVATVDQTGLATGVGSGLAAVTATAAGVIGSAELTVTGGLSFVDAGGNNSCGVTPGGQTYCWGSNNAGQLGDGTGASGLVPVAVAGGLSFATVEAGTHACGVTTAGQAYCWGYNSTGELGDGTTTDRPVPVAVAGGLSFTTVAVGEGHTCGVTAGGQAYCWGYNQYGQLGDGTRAYSFVPVAVAGGLSFATVSASGGYTCGVTAGGQAYCWGSAQDHRLTERGLLTTDALVPVAVAGGLSFATVEAGGHACGVTTAGQAYCWGGNNAHGQLGDGTVASSFVPVAVAGGLSFATVSAGLIHTCGVSTGGEVYCWGYNELGGLGDGTTTDRLVPVAVSGGLSFATVSAGIVHTCGVTTGGQAYCWGSNFEGQLGDGTTTDRLVPVRVAFP